MFDKPSHKFEVNYIFQNDPRVQIIESGEDRMSQGRAARHLIELHNGDAENSLVMPDADADEGKLLEQAEVMGITDIRVTKLIHEHKPGTTPGHYQQP
ncbi:hypothetical protein NAV33_11590 [Pseudomonas stutzeri]|uniref:hypothetical protein n=1 Tax=Stutzerimonas stutzeri TaxID=316 RepID=UPI002109E60E|nr:hypothetical protein [Stutzerimonas stutzeri]MCQ4312536.1 hypothetical protein [Stutzerimonas stutzeri]